MCGQVLLERTRQTGNQTLDAIISAQNTFIHIEVCVKPTALGALTESHAQTHTEDKCVVVEILDTTARDRVGQQQRQNSVDRVSSTLTLFNSAVHRVLTGIHSLGGTLSFGERYLAFSHSYLEFGLAIGTLKYPAFGHRYTNIPICMPVYFSATMPA